MLDNPEKHCLQAPLVQSYRSSYRSQLHGIGHYGEGRPRSREGVQHTSSVIGWSRSLEESIICIPALLSSRGHRKIVTGAGALHSVKFACSKEGCQCNLSRLTNIVNTAALPDPNRGGKKLALG
jgi:hypothetical protein